MTQGRPENVEETTREARSGEVGVHGAGDARWKAVLTVVLLLVTGGILGVTADRLWIRGPSEVEAAPLTVDAMARSLNLAPGDRARVGRLLDSLEVEVARAARSGPDSLRSVARRARVRLEGALPPGARPEFRRWMQLQHRRMMERMHGPGTTPMHRDGMGPMHRDGGGMMRPGEGGMTPPREGRRMRPDTPLRKR